jgi:signal transduction histidine kinase
MITIIVPLLLVVMATGGLAALSAYHEANEIYDAQLSHLAKILLAIESQESNRALPKNASPSIEVIQRDQKYEKNIAFRVWVGDHLLHRSKSAKDFGERFNIDGFSKRMIAGDYWKVFVLSNTKQDIVVEVAERLSIRAEMTWFIVGAISIPLFIMLPLVMFFAWHGIARGLQPLQCLSREVTQRSPHDLAPIATGEQPAEILPLLNSINTLMGQLGGALETERRFTDYAAHELRTPLAAIKTLFQTACKSEDANERKYLASKLEQAINRATHLVTQLLTLARVGHADLEMKLTDITALTHECVEELQAKLDEKQQTVNWLTHQAFTAHSYAPLLKTLVHNILHNAIHYTPESGHIDIAVTDAQGRVTLTITDTGPGIPKADRDRVFETFYRGEEASPGGAGLGLSIVRTIAVKLGIEVVLNVPKAHNGLEISISFPR